MIVIANVGAFLANTYASVYIDKLTQDDWKEITDKLSANHYPLLLATVILTYANNFIQAVRSCMQKCMEGDPVVGVSLLKYEASYQL